MTFKILYVGDDAPATMLSGIAQGASDRTVYRAGCCEKALTVASRERPDLVVIDLDQTTCNPLSLARALVSNNYGARIIGLTENKPLNMTAKALNIGIEEVINTREQPKRLGDTICELTRNRTDMKDRAASAQPATPRFDFTNIIGESPEMRQVLEIVSKVIKRKWVTVLIRGETGTGKELVAQAIHDNSFAQTQPFVEINCNVLPDNLLESELFGYERGAFTGATTQKKGLFELAENGTLFLDEIGEISPAVQVKLLKALEQKRIRHLGGTEDIRVNTRIIAATNRDLQKAIHEGDFRSDLYYRLNVISVYLPPLRERGDDVILLAHHFLAHYKTEYESQIDGFTPDAEALLRSYPWPGNVRELNHTIERIVLLSEEDRVTRESLEDAIESKTPLQLAEEEPRSGNVRIDIPVEGLSLDEIEKLVIKTVLKKMNWNKRKTSQALRIPRTRLDRKIVKYGLKPEDPD